MSLTQRTDLELLDLMRSGHESGFTELYNRYWKTLLVIATNKTGDLDEAEEIVQDIFVSLWRRKEELKLTSSLKNYLAVSVKYRVIKSLAKQNLKSRFGDDRSFQYDLIDDSTQQWLEFEELQRRLSDLVAELPEKCRLVYKMSRESGYSQRQIAEELGISEKTVEAHLGKALKTLRTGLNQFLFSFVL
ncbi:RNA polymerase sigma-70 factor [Dyadobacter sp. CY261]|uniref:RNA polymerase sigma-70 factor n=1 Tax=Dyadobacter sp. CY261 TaxID=2907203 RepID=UPI001F2FF4F0|nr:RNA polymerase sigma-70 factor [Dyadobacter sp. CY261]MCF0072930.1 RNA polymerase sigma-70 factor [Dyadobacter sp. CY261]